MLRFLLALWLSVASVAASAAPPFLAPSQFNNGAPVDTDVVGKRVPLVLVHGLGGSGDGWENFLQAYAVNASWRAAFKPYTLRYETNNDPVVIQPSSPTTITRLGKLFRDTLQYYYDQPVAAPSYGFGGKSVVILAHSMGGLVARSMMQEYVFADGKRGGERVIHLITLGTPHQGTPLADAAYYYGISLVDEFLSTHRGLALNMAWTNYDSLDMPSRVCNPWLAQLNTYDPAADAYYPFGECGTMRTVRRPGFYERIIAYGARSLQPRQVGFGPGIYEPGSALQMTASHTYLREALPRSYDNDGIVPLASAQFERADVWARKEAFNCDHRYLERGYEERVRTPAGSYDDWAFCAASAADITPSGVSGGRAIGGTIVGAPGGIVDTVKTVSYVERIFAWAEVAHAQYLQPTGAVTQVADRAYLRTYASTQAMVQVKDGKVYYRGPASGQNLVLLGTLGQFLAQAEAAGY